MAFTVKMTRKAAGLGDYVICKLECLLMSGNCQDLSQVSGDDWQWQLMIRTPDTVNIEDINTAATAILKKGKTACVDNVRLDTIHEGQCVQMLHVGPYDRDMKPSPL